MNSSTVGSEMRFLARLSRGSEPFILTAMISLVFGTVWMFRERELLLGHFYRPELLSITHTVTLGWITMLMMGMSARLVPRALGVEVRSRRLLLVQFLLMLIGYTGMVFHFWISGWVAMASAAILIVFAAGLQIYNFAGVFARLRGHGWLPRYVAAAMIHFVLAAMLGVLIGFNKIYDILGGEFFSNIFAHVHLAAVGWVTFMIVGFEHRLLPPSAPRGQGWWIPGLRFWLLEIGLLGVTVCLLAVSRLLPFFASLLVAGLVWHAARPLALLARGKLQDRASLWASVALIFLVADALAGLALVLGFPADTSPLRMRLQLVYGYAGLLGWVTLTIHALSYKLFPMFVWQERFSASWGREPVPAMRDLYSTTLQNVSAALVALGVAGAAAGILAAYLPIITFFHGMVILGTVLFLINFIMVARWSLLRLEYRPSPEDWARFRLNFPEQREAIFAKPAASKLPVLPQSTSTCDGTSQVQQTS